MRDTTGEDFKRFEFLCAEHLLLELQPRVFGASRVSDVVHCADASDNAARLIANGRAVREHPSLNTIVQREAKFAAEMVAGTRQSEPSVSQLLIITVHARRESAGEQSRLTQLPYLLQARIGVGAITLRIREKNSDRRRFAERTEACFTLTQRGQRHLTIGHVLRYHHGAGRITFRVAQRAEADFICLHRFGCRTENGKLTDGFPCDRLFPHQDGSITLLRWQCAKFLAQGITHFQRHTPESCEIVFRVFVHRHDAQCEIDADDAIGAVADHRVEARRQLGEREAIPHAFRDVVHRCYRTDQRSGCITKTAVSHLVHTTVRAVSTDLPMHGKLFAEPRRSFPSRDGFRSRVRMIDQYVAKVLTNENLLAENLFERVGVGAIECQEVEVAIHRNDEVGIAVENCVEPRVGGGKFGFAPPILSDVAGEDRHAIRNRVRRDGDPAIARWVQRLKFHRHARDRTLDVRLEWRAAQLGHDIEQSLPDERRGITARKDGGAGVVQIAHSPVAVEDEDRSWRTIENAVGQQCVVGAGTCRHQTCGGRVWCSCGQ